VENLLKTHIFNPLTPVAFCKNRVFWTFWQFLGWILAKLALIWSTMHLQHNILPFLPLASCFMTFWLRHALKSGFSNFGGFFGFSFFSFSFVFAAVIGLLLGLLAVRKRLRKRHRDGQFL